MLKNSAWWLNICIPDLRSAPSRSGGTLCACSEKVWHLGTDKEAVISLKRFFFFHQSSHKTPPALTSEHPRICVSVCVSVCVCVCVSVLAHLCSRALSISSQDDSSIKWHTDQQGFSWSSQEAHLPHLLGLTQLAFSVNSKWAKKMYPGSLFAFYRIYLRDGCRVLNIHTPVKVFTTAMVREVKNTNIHTQIPGRKHAGGNVNFTWAV